MKKLVFLILCGILLVGCEKEEIPSGKLIPVQQPALPIMQENIDYERRPISFASVFSLVYGNNNLNFEQNLKKNTILVNEWMDTEIPYETFGIVLLDGQNHLVSFDAKSDVASSVTVQWATYEEVLHEETFSIGQEETRIQASYVHHGWDIYDSVLKLIFRKGSQNTGTIEFDQFQVKYASGSTPVRINQHGYLPESQKLAIFNYNSGDWFDVINTETNEIVYTGSIEGRIENSDADEVNYVGDFSSVTTPGTYRIVSQIYGKSYDFAIQENLYHNLLQDSLKMITLQRCGHILTDEIAGGLAHESCHLNQAKGYSTWDYKDVSGGWHDAGDYGRYTITAVKTMNDLLLSYYVYPESFTDAMNLPESGNGIPDVLDEAKIGIEWLKKIQYDWGTISSGVVTTQFADFVSPENDTQELWRLDSENTSTASASGAFALASIVFEEFDQALAEDYLNYAKSLYSVALNSRHETDKKNPDEISAGHYNNGSDEDELYFAAAALYAKTHEEVYLDYVQQVLTDLPCSLFGLTYEKMAGYGSYLLLKDEEFKKTPYYVILYNKFMSNAQQLVLESVNNGYQFAIDSYHWGANMNVMNSGMMMLLANDLEPSQQLMDAAFEQISYVLGKNGVNMSLVTGYGKVYPRHVHHRITEAKNTEIKGALVGGPDGGAESDLPAAKRYWDEVNSYNTNEIAIYYNSPFVFVLSAFQD